MQHQNDSSFALFQAMNRVEGCNDKVLPHVEGTTGKWCHSGLPFANGQFSIRMQIGFLKSGMYTLGVRRATGLAPWGKRILQ